MIKVDEVYDKIIRAKELLSEYIHETPIDKSSTLSKLLNAEVMLKLENLQKTGSFKVRGAFNKIFNLNEEQKKKGVIAVSAGNHAQGVAYAAMRKGIKAVVVMPETAPISKFLATKSYGAEVILYGKYIHESMNKAMEIIEEKGLTLIHPYDDPYVIAGQGTLGLELIPHNPDVVVVPIGGGGLISGIAVALKYKRPNTRILGVQTTASPSMKVSKELGRVVEIEPSYSIADGILVKTPSELTLNIVEELVDDIVLVDDEEIANAILFLLERNKTLAEGAGAASVAALLSGLINIKQGQKVIPVISGGNIDLSLLAKIIDKMMFKMKRIVKVEVIVPDKPGYLNKILTYIAKIRGNVIDVIHDRISSDVKPGYTKIYVIFELPFIDVLNDFLISLYNEGINAKLVE
jgi:threonine dehydratase